MPTARWNGRTLAQGDDTVLVEGNHYFPKSALDMDCFRPSDHQTVCPWKGTASYFHIEVDGKRNENAAWYYAAPKSAAANIRDRVAFWKGVTVSA